MKASRSLLRLLTLIALVALDQVAETSAQVETPLGSIASIRAVRFHVEPGQTRVWFETSGAVLYTHYSPDPLTLVIDLPGVDISALPARTVVGSREVESVLATSLEGINGKALSRIEIKLAAISPYRLSGSEETLSVVFDGGEAPEPPVSGTEATSPRPVREGASLAEPPRPAPVEEIRETPLAEPSDPEPPSHPASAIRRISHEMVGDVLRVRVQADGRLNYTTFRLDGPKRLVFDFSGVLNAVARAAFSIDEIGVARVRVAQFRTSEPRITRVVFDLDEDVTHRALASEEGLEISFARSEASLGPAVQISVASAAPKSIGTEEDAESVALPALGLNGDGAGKLASEDGGSFEPVASFEPVTLTAQDLSLANPAPSLPSPPPPQEPTAPQVPAATPGSSGLLPEQLEEREYTGELISLDFKDGDIQDIFRLFGDISGLNIVVQPGVTGRITLKLVEVPWDQALELILKTNKLGYVVEGNVIRIAPLAELAAEEQERRRLAEEQALSGALYTRTRVLSYAKANEIMPLLQRNLSSRGDIVIDERTNTVIFTDLAGQITAIDQLIDTLDTPIPGVEIEARIVVTTRNFERQLGVQWGFTSNQTPAFGNTTELVFPNRIQLDGQAIGSGASNQFTVPGAATGGLAPPVFQEFDTSVQRGYAVNLPFAGEPTGAIGISLGSITGAFSIDAALSAAERRGQVRVLSAPKIMTQNNRPAEIKQGTSFPVQVVANNTITVQFKDAVLELQVTPQITSADTIIMDIVVNNDIADFANQVQGIPSIRTQSATTQVLVADGSTTVIGGVFVNTQQLSETYVPLLHKIPILGYLFKNKQTDTSNEELLIFLTPRIRKETV